MSTCIAAFFAGIFVSPIVFIAAVGADSILRIAKQTLTDAESKPRNPERDAAIEDLREKIAKLESLMNRLTDRHED